MISEGLFTSRRASGPRARHPGVDLWRDSVIWSICARSASEILHVRGFPRWCHRLYDRIFCGRIFPYMHQPRMPFWRNLGGIVIVLSVVHPTLSTWNLFFCVVVLKIAIAELVTSDLLSKFGVANIVGVAPPLPEPGAPDVPYSSCKRHHS